MFTMTPSDSIDWNQRFVLDPGPITHAWQGVPAGIEHLRDIVFKKVGGRGLRVDVFRPDALQPVARRPVIVWVPGGGLRSIGRHGCQQHVAWITAEGYAVVNVEYRTTNEGHALPTMIEDVKAAVRWVRAHAEEYRFDPNRIGAMGASAGGHLVALTATTPGLDAIEQQPPHLDQSSAVHAACSVFGPSDLRPYDRSHPAWARGSVEQRQRMAGLCSPIEHVSSAAPPHLLVHGDNDAIVPLEHSTKYQVALQAAGVECTLAELPGVGHDGLTVFGSTPVKQMIRAFFARHLKP